MGKTIDLRGQRFGRLVVIDKDIEISKKKKRSYWLCQCDCGNQKVIRHTNLTTGETISCGCYAKEISSQIHTQDLTGQRFGAITALYKLDQKYDNCYVWHCKCDCGKEENIPVNLLKLRKSCGCLTNDAISKAQSKDLTGQVFGKLTALYPTKKRSGSHIIWHCKCECGEEKDISSGSLISGDTQSCGCIKASIGEINIQKILEQNNIKFEKEKIFEDFIYKETGFHPRYDFYLPEYNRLIEFDGRQHYQEINYFRNKLLERKNKDIIKNEYAKSHHIELIRIPYWERNNITLEMLLGNQYLMEAMT